MEIERERRQVQLEAVELAVIASVVRPSIRLLVFGMGNDSQLWHCLNREGRTLFVEDDPKWFDKVKRECPSLEACLVDYGTVREAWKRLIDYPEKLWLDLPDSVIREAWDVVLVDGPAGYQDGKPGRMKSIYMAHRLVNPGGHVFVHDCERTIEAAYADRYLLKGNLVKEVRGRALLRHYTISP